MGSSVGCCQQEPASGLAFLSPSFELVKGLNGQAERAAMLWGTPRHAGTPCPKPLLTPSSSQLLSFILETRKLQQITR